MNMKSSFNKFLYFVVLQHYLIAIAGNIGLAPITYSTELVR